MCIPPEVKNAENYDEYLLDSMRHDMSRAIESNSIECVRAYLDHGCDPCSGDYPPILSVRSIEMVDLMLLYGADLNTVVKYHCKKRYFENKTDLFEIICGDLVGSYYLIRHINEYGSEFSSIHDVSDAGELELCYDAQLILFLIEHGLRPQNPITIRGYLTDLIEHNNFEAFEFFVDRLHVDIHIRNNGGENLLFDAIRHGNPKWISVLFEYGLENSPNNRGQTPLEYAIYIESHIESGPSAMNAIVNRIRSYEVPVKDPGID
jgi:ankyrin repeat protein